MNLHFHLPASEIEKKINQLYAGVLFEGNVGDFGAWARVEKRDEIKIECLQDRIITHIPLKVKAKLKWKEKLLGGFDILTPKVEETEFEITGHFTTRIEAMPDWELSSETLGNFFWDKKPKVGVGLLKVNVTAILQPRIMVEVVASAKKIDDFITHKIGLREKILEGWKFFRNPISLKDTPPIYGMPFLKSGMPVATPLQCDQNSIRCGVSIPTSIKVFVKKGYANVQRNPLPAFQPVASLPDAFEEIVESEIDFPTLCEVYDQHEFRLKNIIAQVKGMGIKCKKNRLNTSFSLTILYKIGPISRSSRAVAFISFDPEIDVSGKLKIGTPDLEILTGDPFVKGLLRFKKKRVAKLILEETQALIDGIHALAAKEIAAHLNGFRVNSNIEVNGQLEDFVHEGFQLMETSCKLFTRVKGKAGMEIGNL